MTATETRNSLWFAPFNPGKAQALLSPYDDTATAPEISEAQAFTVSLETALIGKRPPPDLMSTILSRRRDVLITSTAFLGSKPSTRRVHYYQNDVPTDAPLKEFLASTMYVCDDYNGKDKLWLDIRILEVVTSDGRDAAIKAFQTLASASGAIFPVILPYTAVASSLAPTIDSIIDAMESDPVMLLSEPIELFPAGSPNRAQLRSGRYVAFPSEVDGTKFQLQTNGVLTNETGQPFETPYVVVRVDVASEVTPELVVPQRIATLLTQLEHGSETNPISTSFEFLQQTLTAYSNFKDLRRYAELAAKKASELTDAEKELMARIASREDLKDLLPK